MSSQGVNVNGAGWSGSVVMAAVFGLLAEQGGLQREDVVQHPLGASAFEPVVGDHPGVLEVQAERGTQRTVYARLAADLRFLEKLEAPVEGNLPRPVCPRIHLVPSTSTRPSGVTRTCTGFRACRP